MKFRMQIEKWLLGSLFFLSLLFMVSCKEEVEEFNISESRIEILLNEKFELSVSGVESFSVALSDEGIIEYTTLGNVISIKGVKKGATTMEIIASDGQNKSCFIIVRENEADVDFVNNPLSRIEWSMDRIYSEEDAGSMFTVYSSMDALGGTNTDAITYDFSSLASPEKYYRVSASGDLAKAGELSDGLIVIQRDKG